MTPLTGPLASRHGFFTRLGGVSTGPYASLNCKFWRNPRFLKHPEICRRKAS